MKTLNQKPPVLLAVFLFAVFTVNIGHAQIGSANNISFQGALTGANGQPLANGNYNLTFKFFTNATTLTALATSNVPNVPITGGIASTPVPVDAAWFQTSTHLGVTINGAAELLPRIPVTAVPTAMYFKGPRIDMQGRNLGLHFREDLDPSGNWALQTEAFQNGHFGFIRRDPFPQLVKSLVISPQGNVGIGTLPNSPSIKLDVLGKIQATRIGLLGPNLSIAFDEALDPSGNWALQTEAFANGNFGIIRRDPVPSPTFIITPAGNVGIGTASPVSKLDVAGTARMTVCQITSDRAAKNEFTPVCARDVLAKLAAVPISTWAYTNAPGIRHIGPVAQDFALAFAVGEDDKHIATVDADGVALAAIQGLNQKLEEKLHEKDTEIAHLRSEVNAILARLESMSRQLPAAQAGAASSVSASAAKSTQTVPGEEYP